MKRYLILIALLFVVPVSAGYYDAMEQVIQLRATIPENEISSALNVTLLDGDFRGLDYDSTTKRFKPFHYPIRAITSKLTDLGYTFTQISNSLICVGGEENFNGQVEVRIDNRVMEGDQLVISGSDGWYESALGHYFDTAVEMLSPEIADDVEKKCQGSVILIMSENLE
ncbi:hypothetical protein ACPSL3_07680 [Vibrio owensii]|uniref:hypothetical protein n=1 Tax=Vibrio owensii TaxID=696485 RepID=UPI003CE4FE11